MWADSAMTSLSTWGPTEWVIIGVLTILTYIASWIVFTRTFHRFADIPGPFWASVSRGWLVRQVMRGDLEKTTLKLHQIYGPLVRIAPGEISIGAPSAMKQIYGASKTVYRSTDFYPPMRSHISKYPDHITNIDPELHIERRKIVTPLYTNTAVLEVEPHMTACVKTLVQQLRTAARSDTTLDLAEWMQYYTFDVIGELYFGAPFGFLAKGSDHGGWINALDTVFPYLIAACAAPNYMRWLFPVVAMSTGRLRAALRAHQTLIDAAKACVAERQQKMNRSEELGRADMLSKLFAIKEAHEYGKAKGVHGDFGIAEVTQEAFGGIFAGSDTTAIALRSIFYHLMKNPDMYQKLRSEIDAAVEAGNLLKGSDEGFVRYADAVKLPYLTACCKEGMRLHPSVGMAMPRHVPKGGAEIAGRWFKGDDRVGINATVVHHDKAIFGDDAAAFRPDRWLEGVLDASNMDRHMLHFSMGRRACIGKNIALMEIYKTVPQLIWEFDMELAYPEKEWVTINAFLNKQTDIWAKLKERERVAVT